MDRLPIRQAHSAGSGQAQGHGFHHAQSAPVLRKMQWQMRERMRRWLWKKQAKTQAHYGPAYRDERLHEHYGLIRFPMQPIRPVRRAQGLRPVRRAQGPEPAEGLVAEG